MRLSCCLLLLLTAFASSTRADERFSVLVGGTRIGHLTVDAKGNTLAIDYDYKNNGRGPTLKETIELGADGLPQRWRIDGSTTFGSPIAESFARDGDGATWTDALGPGEANAGPAQLYVAQDASPWALGLYARALLAAPGNRLPALPAGELQLTRHDPLRLEVDGGAVELPVVSVGGIDLNPDFLVLDGHNALYAVISPNFVLVREGGEADDKTLRDLAARLSAERLEAIQQRTAQRFDAPVRLRNVRVFDAHGKTVGAPQTVIVYRNRISALAPLDSPVMPGEVLIDGEGGVLVPGLFEMHGHFGQAGGLLNLAAGITSVRDMGNNNAVLDETVARIESGEIGGPRLVRSGFIEGRSPFSSNNGRLVDSEAAAVDAVRWYAARGYWQVKLYNSLKPEWVPAIIAEARRHGLRVAGHVPAFANANQMIDAGYDEITHINQLMLGWVLGPDEDTRTLLRITGMKRLAGLDLDSAPVQATLDRLVKGKVAVEPTMVIHESALLGREGELPVRFEGLLAHLPIAQQRDARKAWLALDEPGDDAAYRAAYATILKALQRMHQRGIVLIPGTDMGGGFNYHRELMLFQQIGMTPAEVLAHASLGMARYLGQDQQLGSIERGKLADFFLVEGDPTQDLAALRTIRLVAKDGVFYAPAQIHAEFGIRPIVQPPSIMRPAGG